MIPYQNSDDPINMIAEAAPQIEAVPQIEAIPQIEAAPQIL
jgi:hypothetical protein